MLTGSLVRAKPPDARPEASRVRQWARPAGPQLAGAYPQCRASRAAAPVARRIRATPSCACTSCSWSTCTCGGLPRAYPSSSAGYARARVSERAMRTEKRCSLSTPSLGALDHACVRLQETRESYVKIHRVGICGMDTWLGTGFRDAVRRWQPRATLVPKPVPQVCSAVLTSRAGALTGWPRCAVCTSTVVSQRALGARHAERAARRAQAGYRRAC